MKSALLLLAVFGLVGCAEFDNRNEIVQSILHDTRFNDTSQTEYSFAECGPEPHDVRTGECTHLQNQPNQVHDNWNHRK